MVSVIRSIDVLQCHASWRNYNFVKVCDADGNVGWSEFDEGFGSPGVGVIVRSFAPALIGYPVDRHEHIMLRLKSSTRPSQGGVVSQAIGAIENALLDVQARRLGVPCHVLLGGKVRDRVRVYWSHAPTWRIARASHYGNAITDRDGLVELGREVSQRGFTALKTNLFRQGPNGLEGWVPGFGRPDEPGLVADRGLLRDLVDHITALREGAGDEVDILLDLNFNFRAGGFRQVLAALHDLDLYWVEIDCDSPAELARVRSRSRHRIAGCETLIGGAQFLPYLAAGALDVAVIDGVWNGMWQALKIAALAEAHQINVAPHNFYGHLSTFMNLHWSAVVPNLEIFEVDVDRVPIDATLFSETPAFENGELLVPDTPGWGCVPDEEVIAANPPHG